MLVKHTQDDYIKYIYYIRILYESFLFTFFANLLYSMQKSQLAKKNKQRKSNVTKEVRLGLLEKVLCQSLQKTNLQLNHALFFFCFVLNNSQAVTQHLNWKLYRVLFYIFFNVLFTLLGTFFGTLQISFNHGQFTGNLSLYIHIYIYIFDSQQVVLVFVHGEHRKCVK